MAHIKESFTQKYITELDSIYFRLQHKVAGSFSGNRRSKAKGSSVEFSDFRSYIKGDDIRRIDWNSYARLNKLFIKVFEEEKQANINLFIDTSKSMNFGLPDKLYYSKMLAASVAYICLKTSDRVNIYTFDSAMSRPVNAVSSAKAFGTVIDFLDGADAGGETGINEAFDYVINNVRGKGVSIVMSDFFDPAGYEKALSAVQAVSDISYAIQVLSPEEIEPDINGQIKLIDVESDRTLDLEIDEHTIISYKKVLDDYTRELMHTCRKKSIDFTRISTNESQIEWLRKLSM